MRYAKIIDFKELIRARRSEEGTKMRQTTRGKIHYSKVDLIKIAKGHFNSGTAMAAASSN